MKMLVTKVEMSCELEVFCNRTCPTHHAVNALYNMERPQALPSWSTLK